MSKHFEAIIQSDNGRMKFRRKAKRGQFKDLLKKRGIRFRIEQLTPESEQLRRYFEGAICPMFAFFQDYLDHRDWRDVKQAREFIKVHFNGELMEVDGIIERVPVSTKGREVLKRVTNEAIDYMEDHYGIDRKLVLDPKHYEHWRDTVFPYGGSDNYIDYLVDLGRLKDGPTL